MKSLIFILMATVFSVSCVSTSTHKKAVEELESQLNQEKAQVAEQKMALGQIEEKLIATTKDRGQLRTSLDEMKQALAEMKARQVEEAKRIKEFQDLTARFKKLTDAGTLSVKIIDGKMVVRMGSDVLFPSGSSRLSDDGNLAIRDVTTQLASISGKRYQVEGHTDNVPMKSETASNWELASARALSVVKTMIDGGLPPERVSAASYGETQPVGDNTTKEGRAANRRIEIVIVPDLSQLPGYEELKKYSN